MGLSGGNTARTRVCVALVVVMVLCVPAVARVRGDAITISPARGRIAAGAAHTCAIASNDVVWCWGDNSHYQLGSSAHAGLSNDRSLLPVQAAALPNGRVARRITSGNHHVCVLADDGTVWCWGDNGFGELGVSGGVQADPVQVPLPTTATLVAAGSTNTCAVLSNTNVMCWGANSYGQLGNGTTNSTANAIPVPVASIPSSFVVSSLDVGAGHVCATSTAGNTWCWGESTDGRLGINTASSVLTPQQLASFGSGGATSVSAGATHTCAVVGVGAWCFGSNSSGQLGSDANTVTSSHTPVAVTFSSAVDMVVAGEEFSCALLVTKTVQCFGINSEGQLGESVATASRHTPQGVAGLSGNVVDVVAGTSHACAVFDTGAVKCWGAGGDGRLGDGGTTRRTSAVSVGSLDISPTTTTTATTPTTPTTSGSTDTNPTDTTLPVSTPNSEQQNSTTAPQFLRLKRNRYITARAIATHVALTIPKTSQGTMRFTIVRGVKYCTFVGTKVKGVRKGSCSILVTLIPKRGSRVLRTAKVVVS